MRLFPPLLVFLCACAPSVIADFEHARSEALADPGPAPADWEPDAHLTLSDAVVDASLEQLLAVHGSVDHRIEAGPVAARPNLVVKRASLSAARCPGCTRVDARLTGDLTVQTPLGAIAAPVRADLVFDAVFALGELDGSRVLTLAPRTVQTLDVSVAGTDLRALTDPLTEWISEAITDSPPVAIAELGGTLPIRAIRVVPGDGLLRLDLLTATPDPAPIPEPDGLPGNGWRLDLSTDALLDIARAASMQAEPLPRGIVAEPTSLYVDGDSFVLGLRLWRTTGRGWWRDYTVRGSLEVVPRQGEKTAIALTPAGVVEEGHSKGAAWADPLAALGQGVILKTLERALETSLPGTVREGGRKLQWEVRIDAVEGRGAAVVAHGGLSVEPTGKGRGGGARGR